VKSVNRDLEAKARDLAGIKGYRTNLVACPDGTPVTVAARVAGEPRVIVLAVEQAAGQGVVLAHQLAGAAAVWRAPIGYRASRRCRLVARAPAARSSTMYQVTQLRGKNSPLSHAKRQRWPRRRAPQAASEPTASQTAADRPSAQMPSALTPQH